jgi:hypothetical protein
MLKRFAFYTIIILLCVPTFGNAQRGKLQNQPKYDNRPLHFGFCLGINLFDFQIRPASDLTNIPGLYALWTDVSPGYSIGIVSNLRLNNYFDFRFIPTFSATVRRLYVEMDNPLNGEYGIYEYQIESSFIQFPFELKFKSERMNNHRWYVLGGVQYNLDLASKEKVEDDTIFKIARNNVAWEAGVGLDIYFEYFKFSPQLKAQFGINNILVQDGTLPVSAIDQLLSRSILINFTFE